MTLRREPTTLVETMGSYWTQFAKTGDPNQVGLPAWPVYDPKIELCLEIGVEVKPRAIPHLEKFAAFEQSLQARITCSFIGSIRDYDRFVVERPKVQGPSFYSDNGRRRIVFQIWDWANERRYRFHLYITRSTESAWQTQHFTSTYRAVLRSELRHILEQAGFTNVRWLFPSDSGFYQPIFIARRNC